MTQSLRELIAEAEASGDWDAVADWCETFEWSEGEDIPVAEFYFGCAAAARPRDELQIIEAVSAARANGTSWTRIGQILGTAPQVAQKQYCHLIDTPESAHQQQVSRP